MALIYVVSAKTERSSVHVAVCDAAEALQRAYELQSPKTTLSIIDQVGNRFTLADFEAYLRHGLTSSMLIEEAPA